MKTLLFDISKEPILFSTPTTPNVHILLEENKKQKNISDFHIKWMKFSNQVLRI